MSMPLISVAQCPELGVRCEVVGERGRGGRERLEAWAAAQGTRESELGPVVGEDGVEVVGAGLGERLDRLEHFQGARGAGEAGPAADVLQIQGE